MRAAARGLAETARRFHSTGGGARRPPSDAPRAFLLDAQAALWLQRPEPTGGAERAGGAWLGAGPGNAVCAALPEQRPAHACPASPAGAWRAAGAKGGRCGGEGGRLEGLGKVVLCAVVSMTYCGRSGQLLLG